MAEQDGAAAGPGVRHDEFMDEDDPQEGSGDEDPDAHSAQDPKPIEEELEELTVIAVVIFYGSGTWKGTALTFVGIPCLQMRVGTAPIDPEGQRARRLLQVNGKGMRAEGDAPRDTHATRRNQHQESYPRSFQ